CFFFVFFFQAEDGIRDGHVTGVQTCALPIFRYNSVFGYFIEVTKSNLASVPAHYTRKQTTVGGERFITPELKEMEGKILGADEQIGRASCRERGWSAVGAGTVKEKEGRIIER